MDFHSLARRDLQALCKKNKIPANLTNVAMADALKSLKSIEWDEEIKQKLMPQSETIEQSRSPLLGSRRVAARLPIEEMNDKEEEMKKETLIEGTQTPATAVRRSSRIQSAMSTRTRARTSAATAGTVTSVAGTRTRKGKQEEMPTDTVESAVVETPAPRRGRTKATETPSEVVAPRSSARPIRQSTRKLAESTNRARSTRTVEKHMTLDPEDDKEAHTVVEELELEKEQTAVQEENTIADTAPEQALEAKSGEASEPNSAEKLELVEDEANQNQDVDLEKEDELVSDEKMNLEEHVTAYIEPAEENIEVGITKSTEENMEEEFGADIPQDKSNTEADGSEQSTDDKLKEIPAEKTEEAVEEILNSNASEEQGDELNDENVSVDKSVEEVSEVGSEEQGDELNDENVSVENSVEEVSEVGSDTNAAPISDEGQVVPEVESEVNQTTLADSPILGLVSEVISENNSDVQDATFSDFTLEPPTETCIMAVDHVSEATTENNSETCHDIITLDAQVAPSEMCFLSPVRAPTDPGVEKMLDSVVRRLARASIKDSAKKIDACVGQKEEKYKGVGDVSELVQNENADKGTKDLNCMSLRKLKALYKNKLIEVNSAKGAEEGKRLPLGQLDENLLV